MAIALVAALAVGSAGPAVAETIVEAMSDAYNTNPDLGAQRAVLRQTDERVSQALANWRPSIVISGEAGLGRFRSTQILKFQNLRPHVAEISLTQPIFRGLRTLAETRATEAEVQAARAQLQQKEQDVLLAAITIYLDVLRDESVVKLQQSNVGVLGQQLTATNARFGVGELTRTDVAQAEARLAGARADLIRAQADLAISRAIYQRVIGHPPGKLVDPKSLGAVPKTEEETITLASENNPNVRVALYRVDAAGSRVDLAFGVLLPTVSLQANASRAYDQNFHGDRFERYELIAQVTIPLYQNGAEYSRVREAKQFWGQRRLELDSARRIAIEQATRAWRNYQTELARIQSITTQINSAAVALEGVRQEAQVGSRTTLEVLNAEQELLNAKVSFVRTQHDANIAYYQVLVAIGQLQARSLALPVQYYDEEAYYKENRFKWLGLSIN
ncbi:MAG: TolC family outer membrane protein [Rhodospirillales bacterium]